MCPGTFRYFWMPLIIQNSLLHHWFFQCQVLTPTYTFFCMTKNNLIVPCSKVCRYSLCNRAPGYGVQVLLTVWLNVFVFQELNNISDWKQECGIILTTISSLGQLLSKFSTHCSFRKQVFLMLRWLQTTMFHLIFTKQKLHFSSLFNYFSRCLSNVYTYRFSFHSTHLFH